MPFLHVDSVHDLCGFVIQRWPAADLKLLPPSALLCTSV